MSEMSKKLCLKSSDCLKSGSEMRQSFDRFGDDLSELILSYLSLKEKSRFECVSKQWQRLVFNKQKDLDFEHTLRQSLRHSKDRKTIFNRFEVLVKKCPNITSIDFTFNQNYGIIAMNSVSFGLQLLYIYNKYCKQLIEINVVNERGHLNPGINEDPYYKQYKQLFKSLLELNPKIRCLDICDMNDLSVAFRLDQLLVTKLKKLCFTYGIKDDKRFEALIENSKRSLKSIKIRTDLRIIAKNDLKVIFNGFSKLSKLESLSMNVFGVMDDSIVGYLSQMANNCPKLESIVIKFPTNAVKLTEDVIKAMKDFKQLKRFEFNPRDVYRSLKTIDCKSLRDCKQLTHLTLSYFKINNNFFDNIDRHLPQLQVLDIKCNDLNDQILSQLSQLRYIRVIKIKSIDEYPCSKAIVMQIIDNCPLIQEIDLSNNCFKTYLNSKSISELKTNSFKGEIVGIVVRMVYRCGTGRHAKSKLPRPRTGP